MKTRNKLLTLLALSAGTAAATALVNQCIKIAATSKNLLNQAESLCFKWRLGTIHYTKSGNGRPLLLIHDLTPASSSYEWSHIQEKLSENYTVYTIDLLGCGQSEKPNLTYTNYLYVQLISDFIQSEIGHRTDVIATGASASLVIMACSNRSELFDRLMFINPDSSLSNSQVPGRNAKLYKIILDLPILGTLLYHIAVSRKSLSEKLRTEYFYNPYLVSGSTIDAYLEAAHLGESPKSVYSSVQCCYTKCNITNALKKIDNSISMIGGGAIEFMDERLSEYQDYNSAIEYSLIPNTKQLPQLEKPAELLKSIQTYFS